MKIKFWGVRGSIATPGKSTVRYGGNTACVQLELDDGTLIILDAGTGIRSLGEYLTSKGRKVDAFLLISHPHCDHIQGFPFFRPAFSNGNMITILGPDGREIPLKKLVADQMNKVYFPLRLAELGAKIDFIPLKEGRTQIGSASVESIIVNHPGVTLGYRITSAGKSIVYISDNEPFYADKLKFYTNYEKEVLDLFLNYNGDPNQRIVEFVSGADILIHDSTYTPEQYADHVGWGHSDYLFAVNLAGRGHVRRLFLYHYDPSNDDDEVDSSLKKACQYARQNGYDVEVGAAIEGGELFI
ncbi:MAG: MBL fold metallo-hydrolase [Candidatus Kryptoniota bacterium]